MNAELEAQEMSVVNWWNKLGKSQIKRVTDPLSSYDLEGDNVIVEVKHRFKAYDTKLIETLKLSTNYHCSQVKGKTFIYIVCDNNGISVFNITETIDDIIKLPEYNKVMEYTHYASRKPIKKLHRNLPQNLAKIWEQEYE
jgi:hypothetical protein